MKVGSGGGAGSVGLRGRDDGTLPGMSSRNIAPSPLPVNFVTPSSPGEINSSRI